MARLSIEQIKAPDLSVASAATARAGESFREGMSSASELLTQYQSGLEQQGDAELTNLLAGAKNEDEWNSIVSNTDFNKMNISAAMRQSIINRRDNILGYENQRADTGLVNANIGNVNATAARTRNATGIDTNQDNRAGELHGVAMADHNWRQGARAEDASFAGAALRAAEENMTNGYSRPQSGDYTQVDGQYTNPFTNGPGTNVGPRADGSGLRDPSGSSGTDREIAYRNGIAAIESDGSGGYSAVGATHEKYGRALGRYQVMEANLPEWSKDALGREVTAEEFMANPKIQDAIFDHRFGEYVEEFGEEGAAQAWFGGERGVGKTGRTDVHGRLNIGQYGSNFVNNIGGQPQPNARSRATQNPNQGGPAQRAYLDALKSSKYQSTGEVLAAYQNMYDYGETGQAAITAADNKLAEEALAQSLLDIMATNVDPTEAVVQFRNENPGATAVERLAMEAKILEATGDGGALSAARLQIGTTGASPADIGIAEATLADIQEAQTRDPFQVSQNGAAEYTDNPAGMMISALDGLGISIKPSDVESAINALAESEGITRAEAAYSYARAAEQESRLTRLVSLGGDNLSNWGAEEFARANFKGDNAAKARAALADDRIIAERIQLATSNLGKLERKIQKLALSNQPVPSYLTVQRDEAQRTVRGFYEEYGNRGTPVEEPTISGDVIPRSNVIGPQVPTPRFESQPIGPGTPAQRIENSLRGG